MASRTIECAGLFLAVLAAFSLSLGQPHVALAATEGTGASAVDKLADTSEGKAALASAGISPEKAKMMLAKLSPEQRTTLERMATKLTDRAKLEAKMTSAGYSKAETAERMALLTDDEIAKLADDPEATTAATGAAFFVAVLAVILVAFLVAWYYMNVEDVPPAPAPAPAPSS